MAKNDYLHVTQVIHPNILFVMRLTHFSFLKSLGATCIPQPKLMTRGLRFIINHKYLFTVLQQNLKNLKSIHSSYFVCINANTSFNCRRSLLTKFTVTYSSYTAEYSHANGIRSPLFTFLRMQITKGPSFLSHKAKNATYTVELQSPFAIFMSVNIYEWENKLPATRWNHPTF